MCIQQNKVGSAHGAMENVWNDLSQPYSLFPRSSLGRGVIFMEDMLLSVAETRNDKRYQLVFTNLRREDSFASGDGGMRLKYQATVMGKGDAQYIIKSLTFDCYESHY
jgi:hypothetical protein